MGRAERGRFGTLTGTPEVSVVIPTRNRARLLSNTLRSALEQRDVELEVIVVDDGSDDETPAVLVGVDDPRLRVVRLERARGPNGARNAGIEAAVGEWIAFLDDDDLWAPAKLRRQLDAARSDNATWSYCGVYLLSPEDELARAELPADPATVLPALLRSNVVQAGCSTVVARADRIRAAGGFENGLATPWDAWIKLAADGRAAAVDEPLVVYRRHPLSFISTQRQTALAEADLVASRHRELARRHGVEFDREQFARWLDSELIRGLRAGALARARDGRRLEAARLQLRVLGRTRSSSDLRRLGRIVVGERVQRAVRRLVPPREPVEADREPVPAWLEPYLAAPGEDNGG